MRAAPRHAVGDVVKRSGLAFRRKSFSTFSAKQLAVQGVPLI